ncbi:hypothetical protein [Chachezhania sediminis]|uniref:hypothetical protein n=1 Tax=Chachezhania sediminis TaxID=2599291 RepID=UPI00131D8DF9|nr:hypothetical protein [Chachezhania sediminis]
MKILILGNSHTAMMIQAADDGLPPGMDVTFLAKPGPGPEGLRLDGKTLVAEDPDLIAFLDRTGMPRSVDLSAYDAVALVAMGITVYHAAGLVRGHALPGWPSADGIGALLKDDFQPLPRPLLSVPAATASLHALAEGSLSNRLLGMVRQATDRPVFVVPQPYPSAGLLTRTDRAQALRDVHKAGDGAAIAALLAAAQARAVATVPDAHVLPRPEASVRHGFLTDPAWMRGSLRLGGATGHGEDDVLHANASYGRALFDLIAQATEKFE